MHWLEQRKLSKLWAQEVMVAKCEQIDVVPDRPECLREVHVISCRDSLIKDDDNLFGGCKPVLDALVNNQLIFDDRREYCNLFVHQVLDSEDQRTIIIIKDPTEWD